VPPVNVPAQIPQQAPDKPKEQIRQIFARQSNLSIDQYIEQYLLENQKDLKLAFSQRMKSNLKSHYTINQ